MSLPSDRPESLASYFDGYVEQVSEFYLPIPQAYRTGVSQEFARLCQIAQQVMEFPLEPDLEPAPQFNPEGVANLGDDDRS